jgi:hypothetical protein
MNLVYANRKADTKNPGVALGRHCVANDIPVLRVSEVLGVSRMTVYNWFSGAFWPNEEHHEAIERFIKRHKRRK